VKNEKSNIQQLSQLTFNRAFKNINMGSDQITALFDSGSDFCTTCETAYTRIHPDILKPDITELIGIGGKKIYTLGSFTVATKLDDADVDMCFHVVRDKDTLYEGVIGTDVLNTEPATNGANGGVFHAVHPVDLGHMSDLTLGRDEISPNHDINLTHYSDNQNLTVGASCTGISDLTETFHQLMASNFIEDYFMPDLDLLHLSNNIRSAVVGLVQNYKLLKPESSPVEMKILLTDEVPVYQRPRRLPYEETEKVDKQIRDWLKEGIVRQSVSKYASPIVLVAKKDGTKRLCCDYRKLNQKIIRDNFPIALIDDVLHKLQKLIKRIFACPRAGKLSQIHCVRHPKWSIRILLRTIRNFHFSCNVYAIHFCSAQAIN